jgi:hypothetical protein
MINVDDILVRWVPYVIGARDAIVVALGWTDFDAGRIHHYLTDGSDTTGDPRKDPLLSSSRGPFKPSALD